MRKTLINLMCNFIFNKEKRKSTRKRLIEKGKFEILSKKISKIQSAIVDPKGMGMLNLMLTNANILDKYSFIFYRMNHNSICIDCGVNKGRITDAMRFMGATVYGFEPHPDLYPFLNSKYVNDEKVILFNQAVWDKDDVLEFQIPTSSTTDDYQSLIDGSTLFNNKRFLSNYKKVKVPVTDLTRFLDETILTKHDKIYFLKIDIEGAEFELVEKIITTGLYKKIEYIACETHARFFKDGNEKLSKLSELIKKDNINNIFLDWA